MTLKQAFGRAVREIRKSRHVSQERLAFEAELSRSFMSQIERGIHLPNVDAIFKIGAVLDIPASHIVARAEALLQEESD